jgi:hypothetical protein
VTAGEAWELLHAIQAGIDARDRDALAALFHEDAVLIGTTAHAAGRDEVLAYLTAVVEGEPFRWEYRDVVPFHEHGFAAFGELVAGELRAPFRLTLVVVDGRIHSFHGSIPYG